MDKAAGFFLLTLIASPMIAFVLAIVAVAYSRRTGKPKPAVGLLVAYTIGYALLMSALVIGLVIWYIAHYETTTGYSAGNTPAGLIFLLPVAIGFGQMVALFHWWFSSVR